MSQLNIADGHIDRLTIVGNMIRDRERVPLIKFFNNPKYIRFVGGHINNNYRYNKQIGFSTQDSQVTVQFNTMKVLDGSDFRIDFNPAKCNEEDMKLVKTILSMVKAKRYTQIDLCVNFHKDIMDYKLLDGRRRKGRLHHDYEGKPETIYRGTQNSDDYIKLYNKKVEQKEEKDKDIDHDWCRVEQTITGKLSENYEDWEWFKGVKLVKDIPTFPEGTDPKDEGVAFAVHMNFKKLTDYKKDYRRKIKDLLEQATYKDEFDIGEEIKKTSIVWETNEVLRELLK